MHTEERLETLKQTFLKVIHDCNMAYLSLTILYSCTLSNLCQVTPSHLLAVTANTVTKHENSKSESEPNPPLSVYLFRNVGLRAITSIRMGN